MADKIKDLFGSDDDDDDAPGPAPVAAPKPAAAKAPAKPASKPAPAPAPRPAAGGAGSDGEASDGGEDGDGEGGRAAPRQRPVGPPLELEAPLLPPPPPGVAPAMVRLSNILSVESRPFDPDTHSLEGEMFVDEAGNSQIRLLDLNVLRWRYGRDARGEETRESNARFVRWSDGSLQLQIGSEVLDVASQDIARDQSHLYVRHPGAGIVQAQAHLERKLVFRPSSLQSKSHKLLTAAIDKRHQKVIKLKKVITSVDPEAEKAAREKEEALRGKDRDLLARKRGESDRRYGVGGGRGGLLTAGFLEGDGDDGAGGEEGAGGGGARGGARKKRGRGGGGGGALADDSDMDSEGSWSEEERPKKGRKRIDSDED